MISPEYAAGFFDGEGCVNFAVSRYRRNGELRGKAISLRVMIGNTDLPILQEFQLTFGGKIHDKVLSSPRAKEAWVWTLTYSEAMPFLRAIQPFVRVKARQIALAIEFSEWRNRPIKERCYKLPAARGTWKRTPETLIKENEFKARLHGLNGGMGSHRGGTPKAFATQDGSAEKVG